MPRFPAIELRSTLLLLGMLTGVAAMGLGLERSQHPLPPGIAASVDGREISEGEVQAALSSLKQAGFAEIDRETVLARLIDEELLLQQALRLDLPHQDRRVRASLVRNVIDASNAAMPEHPPSEAELRAHYEKTPSRFAGAAKLELELAWFRGPEARADAELAHQLWQSGEHPRGKTPAPLPLPGGLVPSAKWREYFGGEVADELAKLPEGGVSEAFRWDDAWGVARVVRRQSGAAPPFADVEQQVRADFQRRQSERRLRALLRGLRKTHSVRLAKGPP